MSHPAAPKSLEALKKFSFERILNEDALTHSLTFLGTLPNPESPDDTVKAVIRIEKTALNPSDCSLFFGEEGSVKKVDVEGSTDIYTWLFGWLGKDRERDLKINVICPATDVHIRKYTRQDHVMLRETPALYNKYVKPYILGFPTSRTQWVDNILNGISEKEKILYSSPEFVILPDMKWDLKTLTSLYLTAIIHDRTIRSLRDLRRQHIRLLKSIQREAYRVVQQKWGLGYGSLRMHIHYQPSYYHFHVHIVNANYQGGMGLAVGQAHLLDDVISLLELDPEEGPSIFETRTLTYGLGDQHVLYEVLRKANEDL